MNTTIRLNRNLHHSLNAVRFNTKIALVDAKALYGELATKASKVSLFFSSILKFPFIIIFLLYFIESPISFR